MNIHKTFKPLKDTTPPPDATWKSTTRNDIVQFAAMNQPEPVKTPGVSLVFSRAAAVCVVLLGVLSYATVSYAQYALPGSALYPVKRASEQIQYSLASSEEKIQLEREFAVSRIQELEESIASGNTEATKEALHESRKAVATVAEQNKDKSIPEDIAQEIDAAAETAVSPILRTKIHAIKDVGSPPNKPQPVPAREPARPTPTVRIPHESVRGIHMPIVPSQTPAPSIIQQNSEKPQTDATAPTPTENVHQAEVPSPTPEPTQIPTATPTQRPTKDSTPTTIPSRTHSIDQIRL